MLYTGLYEEILTELDIQEDEYFLEGEVYRSLAVSHIGSLQLARQVAENALDQANEQNLTRISFFATIVLAWMNERLENFIVAEKLTNQAETLANSLKNDQQIDFVNEWISWIYIIRGICTIYTTDDKSKGSELINRGLDAAKKCQTKWQLAFAYFYRGWFLLQLGELSNSLDSVNKALKFFQEINCLPWQGYVRLVIANIYHDKNETELSIKNSKISIETLEEINVTCCHATSLFWLSRYYRLNDQLETAVLYFEQKLKEYSNSKFSWGVLTILERLAEICVYQGKFDKALEFYSKILDLELTHNHELDNIRILAHIGDIHNTMKNFDQARNFYTTCLAIANKYNRQDWIAESQRLFGIAYLSISDLTKAENYLTEAYNNFNQVGDVTNAAATLISLGDIAKTRGQYTHALEKYQQSITLYSRIGTNINALKATKFPFTLHKIGAIYQLIENYEKSFEYYNQGLDYFTKIKDNSGMIYTNYLLLTLKIATSEVSEASKYNKIVNDLSLIHSGPQSLLLQKMSKALILKNNPRMIKKAKAQELLKEISDSPIILIDITVSAMLNLCDLLINEIKSYGEKEALHELIAITIKLKEISQKEGIPYLLIETLLTESKLAVINSNLDEAQNLLEKAREQAIKQDAKHLILKVELEENNFLEELNNWRKLADQNYSLAEKVRQMDLTEYISSIQKSFPDLVQNVEITD